MVKKQKVAKKSGASFNVKKFWQQNWFALTLVVFLVGVLAFIGVNKMIINNQKKQFDAAEKSLDTLYADIVKNNGQPTEMKKNSLCKPSKNSEPSANYSCEISIISTDNKNSDTASARDYANKIFSTINNSKEFVEKVIDSSIVAKNLNDYSFGEFLNPPSGRLSCHASYTYTDSERVSELVLSCTGDSNNDLFN